LYDESNLKALFMVRSIDFSPSTQYPCNGRPERLFLQSFVYLVLLIVVTGGCSAFHNVSITSSDLNVKKYQEEVVDETINSPPNSPDLLNSPSIPIPPLPSEDSSVSGIAGRSMPQNIIPPESALKTQSADDSTLPWTLEDVFFDYDQYTIRKEVIPVLEQNAKVLLKRFPHREVLVEGHCDERGTEEYNLVLGNRRAMVVKNFLMDLGVPASNLRVLSLGKHEPFCLQPTLQCLQQNRRAHFVLQGD
jgi:peptidoglycan-associated lipoprotein